MPPVPGHCLHVAFVIVLFCFNHYENMSVQYKAISKSEKNDIFRCKDVTFFLFLLKT